MASLADGQLQNSKTTIYTADRRNGMRLEQISFFNDNSATQTIILYIKTKQGSASRKLRQWILDQNESATYLQAEEHLTISIDDALEAETTTENAVDYLVTGDLL